MKVQDYRAGMDTPWYRVIEDAKVLPNGAGVRLVVQHPDAGIEYREFDFDQDIPLKDEA